MSQTKSPSAEEIYRENPETVEELAERDDALGAACQAVLDLAGGDDDE